MVQGTDQNSNVSTLGGSAVVGKGQTAGLRAIINLPNGKDFYHSVTLGLDYKHFGQDLMLGGDDISTPTTYYPLSAAYNANWTGNGYSTELNTTVTFNLRGLGSSLTELDNSRFKATGNFIDLRGDLAHTHDLPVARKFTAGCRGRWPTSRCSIPSRSAAAAWGRCGATWNPRNLGTTGFSPRWNCAPRRWEAGRTA